MPSVRLQPGVVGLARFTATREVRAERCPPSTPGRASRRAHASRRDLSNEVKTTASSAIPWRKRTSGARQAACGLGDTHVTTSTATSGWASRSPREPIVVTSTRRLASTTTAASATGRRAIPSKPAAPSSADRGLHQEIEPELAAVVVLTGSPLLQQHAPRAWCSWRRGAPPIPGTASDTPTCNRGGALPS